MSGGVLKAWKNEVNSPLKKACLFRKMTQYSVMVEKKDKKPPVFVVSGASGSGKTSLCRKIARKFDFYYSISHTTREKREMETDGVDYFFVTHDEFQKKIDEGEFIEWAKVYDNFYGTSKKIIQEKLEQGRAVILDVETVGAANLKATFPDEAVLIFIETPSIKDLEERLRSRGRDTEQEIEKRVAYAQNEISKKDQYDHIVLNDDFDTAFERMSDIVKQYI